VSEAHDNALTLQTDWSMFSRKKKDLTVSKPGGKQVAPVNEDLTLDIKTISPWYRIWCVLPTGNGEHYAVEDGFGFTDYENPGPLTFKSRFFLMSPKNTDTPVHVDLTQGIPVDSTDWTRTEVLLADLDNIKYFKNPARFFGDMQRDHPQSFWNRMRVMATGTRTNPYIVRRVGAKVLISR